MTTLPALVRIVDLPAGSAVVGTELVEAVQTIGGVAQSVQLSLSQIVTGTIGALPPSGGTGQVLKSLGTGFAASWVNMSALVTASTGLAETGSTTIAMALASTAGLSVLGVAGTGSAVPAPVVGTGAQVLVINDGGTVLTFGRVNLASAAAVTGVLPGANFSAVNLGATGAGGVQGLLPGTSIITATIPGAQMVTATIGTTQLRTAAGLSVLAVNSSGTAAFSVVTGSAAQVLVVNDAGTSVGFGQVNLASSAAVKGVLPGANMSAVNLAASGAGGVQGVLGLSGGGTGTSTVFTQGGVVFNGTSGILISDSTTLFWDDANTCLGVGINTPFSQNGNLPGMAINKNFNGELRFSLTNGGPGTAAISDIEFSTPTANSFTIFGLHDNNGSPFWQHGMGGGVIQAFWDSPIQRWRNVAGNIWMQLQTSILTIAPNTGLVSGGTTGFGLVLSSVSNFGIFCGTGVPSISAGTGSIYIRNDGATATSRMYVNTNGTGGWTAFNTVA